MDKKFDLALYYFPSCPFCQRVLSTIDQLGLKIEYKNILQDQEANQKLLNDTGRTTVPCLYINGSPMFESSDIMVWLQENQESIEKSE